MSKSTKSSGCLQTLHTSVNPMAHYINTRLFYATIIGWSMFSSKHFHYHPKKKQNKYKGNWKNSIVPKKIASDGTTFPAFQVSYWLLFSHGLVSFTNSKFYFSQRMSSVVFNNGILESRINFNQILIIMLSSKYKWLVSIELNTNPIASLAYAMVASTGENKISSYLLHPLGNVANVHGRFRQHETRRGAHLWVILL
jgi:hypothetical protein